VLGLDVTVNPSNASCKDSNGSVSITVNEASNSYTYELYQGNSLINSVTKSSATHVFNGLDIGTYQVRSTKADGCFNVSEFSISEPTLLEATSSKLYNSTICNGEILNGSLQATDTGGVPPYTYSIDGGETYQEGNVFSVASEKTYEITVKDANGCTALTSVAVGFDPEIEYEVTQEDVICVGDSDGRISVNLVNDQGYEVSYSLDGTNYKKNPDFTGLTTGTYSLWIKKENEFHSCETEQSVEVQQLIALGFNATTDFSCEGASNIIIASVDPIYENEVTYILDGDLRQASGIFENVTKGQHTVTVEHNEYGCSDEPVTVRVDAYEPITFEVIETGLNVYTVLASGGEPGYEYSLDSADDFGPENELDLRDSRETRDYVFAVRDSRGCVVEKTVFLEFLDIVIPDFFTPEGDGINDTWYPINIEIYPSISVKIFDRYQRLLASYEGNTHSWDGYYKGSPLPSGDYWYVISLNERSDNRVFKGNFSLVR
jgi:gliding motility-associated-like protein